jgi:WD40 repeat protein
MDGTSYKSNFHRERMVKMNRMFCYVILLLVGVVVSVGQAQTSQPNIRTHPASTVLDVAYRPDGLQLAQVTAAGYLEVLDVSTGRVVFDLKIDLPYNLFRAKLDWTPQGDILAAGIGAQIYLWDVQTNEIIEILPDGAEDTLILNEAGSSIPEGFVSLEWNSNGTLLMGKTQSSRHLIWSIETYSFTFDQFFGNNPVSVTWANDDQYITAGSVYLDLAKEAFIVFRTQSIRGLGSMCSEYSEVEVNRDQTLITAGTLNGCVYIINALTGDQLAGYKISDVSTPIWDVAWSPDESAIIAVDSSGAVQVVEIATGEVTLITQHDGPLFAVDWALTDTEIAYGGVSADETTIFQTITVNEVKRLMSEASRQPEFAVTPEAR